VVDGTVDFKLKQMETQADWTHVPMRVALLTISDRVRWLHRPNSIA